MQETVKVELTEEGAAAEIQDQEEVEEDC